MTASFPGIRFGADYNPEQWPTDVWDEDVTLMQRAGVTTATVGVFSWARLEPRPGNYDFDWLDDILDRLHRGGIRVMMATATASPPAWLARNHPDSLPVTATGARLGFGSRQQYSPSSSAYREHALRLVEKLAERYGSHPAIEAWHINNEYACHVARSYDEESAAAFRVWLRGRYSTIEALNSAWGTAFWSQQYGDFDEVFPPAAAPTFLNPTQLLDFDRFSSDALLALCRAEHAILKRLSPQVPVTTNFMGFFRNADYWQWAEELDFVSDDSYPDPADPNAYVRLAASRDLMRSLGGGKPWLLMEQATSAVNWRERNAPKPAGLNRVQSLQAVARGADGILYFQWRQSRAGAEKFHSALLPHGGSDTRIYREVEALGQELGGLADLVGTRVHADVAIVFDWDAWRALEQDAVPASLSYVDTVLAWYRPLLRAGVAVDFVRTGSDLSAYRFVIVPVLVAASDETLNVFDAFVQSRGTLLVTYQTAILDENLHVRLGGYLGKLQDTLGVRVEEFAPVAATEGEPVTTLEIAGEVSGSATLWQEVIRPGSADVRSRFVDGFAQGEPAITRNQRGSGTAWYVATQPAGDVMQSLVGLLLSEAGVRAELDQPVDNVEVIRRGDRLFVLNHGGSAVSVGVGGRHITLAAYDATYAP